MKNIKIYIKNSSIDKVKVVEFIEFLDDYLHNLYQGFKFELFDRAFDRECLGEYPVSIHIEIDVEHGAVEEICHSIYHEIEGHSVLESINELCISVRDAYKKYFKKVD